MTLLGYFLSMERIEIDFHGYSVEEAIRTAESLVSQIRMTQQEVECTFITGKGRIRDELISIFSTSYELQPFIPMANSGVVRVLVY